MTETVMPVINHVNRRRPLKVEEVPNIPRYLKEEELHLLIPTGYDDIVKFEIDKSISDVTNVLLRIQQPEFSGNDTVVIRKTLWNSLESGVEVPMFLMETSTNKVGKDYFGKDKKQILNINQLIYLVLQHRFADYARRIAIKPDTRIYTGLLKSDIKRIAEYIEYVCPNTYNAQKKIEHTYAIIPYRVHEYNIDMVIGNKLNNISLIEAQWKNIFFDIGHYVQPTSETSMSKSNKVTLNVDGTSIFRAPGYHYDAKNKCYLSLFPQKQNIPARYKTHILGNAINLAKPEQSYLQQECYFENGVITPLSNTYKQAVVVFHDMDDKTLKFVCGETYVTSNIPRTLVIEEKSLNIEFKPDEDDKSYINIEQGKIYDCDFNDFCIGTKVDNEDLIYKECKSIEVITLEVTPSNTHYVRLRIIAYAGNARLISHSGFKGVTVTVKDNGFIAFANKNSDGTSKSFSEHFDQLNIKKAKHISGKRSSKNNTVEPSSVFNDLINIGHYLDSKDYDNCTVIKEDELNGLKKLKVDMVTGMNAVKANSNTIVLAQAQLAVKLGYYKPSPKGPDGEYENILNTKDIKEIQDAADSLPDFVYINGEGIATKCHIGLVNIMFTELGKTYANFKPQSFSFEAGWTIKKNHPELYKHIFNTYLEHNKVNVVKELYKILKDERGVLRKEEHLPLYDSDIIRKDMFDIKEDLFRTQTSNFPSQSKLLDKNWNKGFYIDLTKYSGPLIRIPSAQTLSFFVNKLPSNEYSYDTILLDISKIILAILGRDEKNMEMNIPSFNLRPNFHWIWNRTANTNRQSQYEKYLDTVEKILYSGRMLVQSLIKPKIPGVSLKQTVEVTLPDDVVVVTNHKLYYQICKQAGFNHVLDDSNMETLKACSELNQEDSLSSVKSILNDILNDVPKAMMMRQPYLWQSQQITNRVWSIEHFRAYLKVYFLKDLDNYLDDYFNKDVLLISPRTILVQKSDCD